MEYNLLQSMYDKQWELFENGLISLDLIFAIESEFIKRYQLFTINLN